MYLKISLKNTHRKICLRILGKTGWRWLKDNFLMLLDITKLEHSRDQTFWFCYEVPVQRATSVGSVPVGETGLSHCGSACKSRFGKNRGGADFHQEKWFLCREQVLLGFIFQIFIKINNLHNFFWSWNIREYGILHGWLVTVYCCVVYLDVCKEIFIPREKNWNLLSHLSHPENAISFFLVWRN
jgi:hypothetical protein